MFGEMPAIVFWIWITWAVAIVLISTLLMILDTLYYLRNGYHRTTQMLLKISRCAVLWPFFLLCVFDAKKPWLDVLAKLDDW